IKRQTKKPASHTEEIRLKKNPPRASAQNARNEKRRTGGYEPEPEPEEYDSRMEKITTILAVIGAVLIGC
ncbi:hypothetical protein RFY99_00045, partial [Acinetobacter baumannii]|nr:hypothetical protein [Acinetobacter baumannii]